MMISKELKDEIKGLCSQLFFNVFMRGTVSGGFFMGFSGRRKLIYG